MSTDAPVSNSRVDANRANAQLSTGPVSEAGKAKSSLNAVKTGLTGRTVLLPSDDVAAFNAHLARFAERWTPADDTERDLVQSLADTEWRLLRIPTLEFGIYALGRIEFADAFPEQDTSVRPALIDAHIFRSYRRDLSNLSLQEGRLRRQREKDTEALQQLQDKRLQARNERLDNEAWDYIGAVNERREKEFDPAKLGFEFSLVEIEVRALKIKPDLFRHEWNLDPTDSPFHPDYHRKIVERRRKVA